MCLFAGLSTRHLPDFRYASSCVLSSGLIPEPVLSEVTVISGSRMWRAIHHVHFYAFVTMLIFDDITPRPEDDLSFIPQLK
jgi:hypothetical protein